MSATQGKRCVERKDRAVSCVTSSPPKESERRDVLWTRLTWLCRTAEGRLALGLFGGDAVLTFLGYAGGEFDLQAFERRATGLKKVSQGLGIVELPPA